MRAAEKNKRMAISDWRMMCFLLMAFLFNGANNVQPQGSSIDKRQIVANRFWPRLLRLLEPEEQIVKEQMAKIVKNTSCFGSDFTRLERFGKKKPPI
jgi:predicted KAP-like P-loop ATPase